MIIAVGFKVNSERAVQFRKWVNQIAKDYTIKGWVMDDERLKRGMYLTGRKSDISIVCVTKQTELWRLGQRDCRRNVKYEFCYLHSRLHRE